MASNATRNASDDSAATPRSSKTTARTAEKTGEASAATASSHAVPSYIAATTISSNPLRQIPKQAGFQVYV